jgi:hypothetical protein
MSNEKRKNDDPKVKRPYHAPILIQYGPVSEVTRGAEGPNEEPSGLGASYTAPR